VGVEPGWILCRPQFEYLNNACVWRFLSVRYTAQRRQPGQGLYRRQ
jgi:hypothetical protein